MNNYCECCHRYHKKHTDYRLYKKFGWKFQVCEFCLALDTSSFYAVLNSEGKLDPKSFNNGGENNAKK